MKYIIIILSFLVIGCGSYTHTSYRPKIKSLLAITETGDTVSVSVRDFETQKYNTYTRFNYNNNWYWNNWRYNNMWNTNQWWYNQPNRYWGNDYIRYTTPVKPRVKPKYIPKPVNRPRIDRPRTRVTPPTRTRTTPNVQTRTNVGRSSSGGSRGSSVIRKN